MTLGSALKLCSGSGKIVIDEDWEVMQDDLQEILAKEVRKLVSQCVETVFTEEDDNNAPYVEFCVNIENVASPLEMRLCIPQLGNSGDFPEWSFNLQEAIKDDLEQCEEDGSCHERLAQISKGLKDLAKKIDGSVKKGRAV